MRRRRALRVQVAWPALAIAFLAVLTVVLAQAPAGAAFNTTTANGGNTVQAAASFCVAPGSRSLVVHDAYTDQGDPAATHQSDVDLHVRSQSGNNAYTWLLFDLSPTALPDNCVITAANLQVYNYSPSPTTRSIAVHRAAAPWSAASITWNNQPGVTGSPVATNRPGSASYQSWNVAGIMQTQYDSGNYGFRLSDASTNLGSTYENLYYDQNQTSTPPRLTISWG